MIKNFIHKGLRKFYASGSTAGIQKNHEKKLRLILANLDQAEVSDDMDLPGLFMHQLKGDRKDTWSVRVSGNWRIIPILLNLFPTQSYSSELRTSKIG